MHCKQWIFDMDGTLTDSMVVVWEGAPEALLARFGRTPKADLHETLLTMGMEDGAQYLIREYALPLDRNGYLDVMRGPRAHGCACAPTHGAASAAPC